ncbi:MAG: EAL domain-containing protein [Pseudomonas sp.]|nr:EAL domain-containing protein [Pseudomonas sp.]
MKISHSFQTRIATVLILLLLVVVGALYFAVQVATAAAVKQQAVAQLGVGVRVFERLLDNRGRQLRDALQVLSADFGFKDAVASNDAATIRSVLANHGARISASEVLLLGLDGQVLASSVDSFAAGSPFRYSQQLLQARQLGQSKLIVALNGEAHLLVEAPVLAPLPIARVVMGFRMDQAFAAELRELTNLEVSFVAFDQGRQGPLVSTLSAEQGAGMLALNSSATPAHLADLDFAGQHYLTEQLSLAQAADYRVQAFLHSSLDRAMGAFASLDRNILLIALAALCASLVGALLLARSVSQPVRELARVAERVGQGDYLTPPALERRDELGVLAQAITLMQAGIAERERQLAHNALHDVLTGLPNRTLLLERLGSAIAAGRPVALLYLGIGNFRNVNESYGSATSDQVLQQMSQRLQASLRPGDSLARLLADEFLLLLEHADSDSAVAIADRLQQRLAQPLRVVNVDMKLDCRIGIAAYPLDAETAEELVRRAGIAMHDAAQQPGRLQVYQQGRDDAHQRQINLIRDLRRAPANAELQLHYQPKLSLASGRVEQAEALLRWQHPTYGMVSPAEFIPLAERTGSIQLLTAWVMGEALRQLQEWATDGLYLQLSVNVSADDLHDLQLADKVGHLLAQYQVPASQLIFEITESAVMQNPEQALLILQQLRTLGISLSVDDFGTGYSSLSQLKRMPVQELKIDQSFIRDLDETSEDAVIVRSTIQMSHSLGLKVVAEGVEYERSLRLLERWGCDTAQGYLISRPLPAQAFVAWLEQPLKPILLREA